jgi:hypothetical protein
LVEDDQLVAILKDEVEFPIIRELQTRDADP